MTSSSPNAFLSCSLGKEKETRAFFCNCWWLLAFGMHFFQMVHNASGKSLLTLPLLPWLQEGEMWPCTFPEMPQEDMTRCLLGPQAFVPQTPLHLTQGRAEERLVHRTLLTGMRLLPTRSCLQVSHGTTELEIPGHNGTKIPGHNRMTQDSCD